VSPPQAERSVFPVDHEGRPTLAHEEKLTRWPTPEEVRQVLSYVVDPADAPIFAAAVLSQPDIVLSNDFETFHSERAKALWKRHGLQVVYGLLCVFGRRERKSEGE
jgi:hypothetical protein